MNSWYIARILQRFPNDWVDWLQFLTFLCSSIMQMEIVVSKTSSGL